MQRIHLEIRFSVFAVKFSWSETSKPRTRPLSKERARDKTCFCTHELEKLKQLNLHDFTKLNHIAPVVHCSAIDSKLQSFMISSSWKFMKNHEYLVTHGKKCFWKDCMRKIVVYFKQICFLSRAILRSSQPKHDFISEKSLKDNKTTKNVHSSASRTAMWFKIFC